MKDYTAQFVKTLESSENLISTAADWLSDWELTEDEAHRLSETCAWLRGIQNGIEVAKNGSLLEKSGDEG